MKFFEGLFGKNETPKPPQEEEPVVVSKTIEEMEAYAKQHGGGPAVFKGPADLDTDPREVQPIEWQDPATIPDRGFNNDAALTREDLKALNREDKRMSN